MKISSLQITSPTAVDLSLEGSPSLCAVVGNYSALALDLIREALGDRTPKDSPDRVDDGSFVICTDLTIYGKEYSVCYIRNADFFGDCRIAVNFNEHSRTFSLDDTHEYLKRCEELDVGASNVLDSSHAFGGELPLAEGKQSLAALTAFAEHISSSSDRRPVFIYGVLDRIDEAVDITPCIKKLASSKRQVFISLSKSYPCEALKACGVQIIKSDLS